MDVDGNKRDSMVCGFINGIPGDWSRDHLYGELSRVGEIVGLHVRRAADGNYEGVGFVQYRWSTDLDEALREFAGNRHKGKGKTRDGSWNNTIYLRLGPSHKEFDLEGIEDEIVQSWRTNMKGGKGSMSVTCPRVCTSDQPQDQEDIFERRDDRTWFVSPWEMLGMPDERGRLQGPRIRFDDGA